MTFPVARVPERHKTTLSPARFGQVGFTLLEVLIAIVILAIGLLGIAGMQANSIRNNQNAYLRGQATMLAYDIIERMRANRTLAINGNYSVALGSGGSGSGIALTDITEWKGDSTLGTGLESLPSGDGSVTVDLAGNAVVEIRWVDRMCAPGSLNTGVDANCPVNPNCPATAAANLQCFVTETRL